MRRVAASVGRLGSLASPSPRLRAPLSSLPSSSSLPLANFAQPWTVLGMTSQRIFGLEAPRFLTVDASSSNSSSVESISGETSEGPTPFHFELAQRALNIMNGSFDDNEVRRRRQRKAEVLEQRPQLKHHEIDSGSPEVQAAHMTGRIQYLQEHVAKHPKDLGSRRGLDHLIQKRHKMLAYLKRTNEDRYNETIKSLRISMKPSLDSDPKYGRRAKRQRKKMRGKL